MLGRGPSQDVMTQLREGSQLQAWECVGARGIWSQRPSPPSGSWESARVRAARAGCSRECGRCGLTPRGLRCRWILRHGSQAGKQSPLGREMVTGEVQTWEEVEDVGLLPAPLSPVPPLLSVGKGSAFHRDEMNLPTSLRIALRPEREVGEKLGPNHSDAA